MLINTNLIQLMSRDVFSYIEWNGRIGDSLELPRFKFNPSIIVCLLLVGLATRVDAVVTAEASIGRNSVNGTQTSPVTGSLGTMTGSSTNIDVYVQPFGVVPVSVGAFYTMDKTTSSGENPKELSAQTAGFSAYSSLKLMATTLYLKAGYNLMGSSTIKASASETNKALAGLSEARFLKGKVTGYRVGAGVAYEVFSPISATLSYTMARETHSFSQIETVRALDGVTVESDAGDYPVRVSTVGSTIALGLSVNW